MASPFPGMDPYLESRWRDVHARMIVYITDALQEQLPAELRARVEERVVLESPDGDGVGRYPDIRIVEYAPQPEPVNLPEAVGTRGAMVEPFVVCGEAETLTETFIEILDKASGNQVVTVLEVISPSNKLPGPGRHAYLSKQAELRNSTTNLVEIDLLRQGKHLVAVPLEHIPSSRRTRYLVCVRRATNPGKAEVYSIALAQPLPVIKVPLRAQDKDVLLDLQTVMLQVFQRGRYEHEFDYTKDPEPALDSNEAEWVQAWLVGKGLRGAGEPPGRKRKRK